MTLANCFRVSVLLSLCSYAHAETLRILNWEEYMHEDVISAWEAQTQNTLQEVFIDNDKDRDNTLLNPNSHLDIAVVDEVVARSFGEQGKFIEISESDVPTLRHISPFWRNRCSRYAVPYFWGTLGIAYRSDKITTPPTSWADILHPSDDTRGHIGMLNDEVDMLAPALFLQGATLNTAQTEVLKKAFHVLKKQVKHVLTYEYAITYLSKNPNDDDLHLALVYGGDQNTLNEIIGKKGLWKYVVPKEGTILWADCLAIPKTTKNKKLALDFINFLNEPNIAALNAEYTMFASPNLTAIEQAAPEYRNNHEIFPEHNVFEKGSYYQPITRENINRRLRITNSIINLHESK